MAIGNESVGVLPRALGRPLRALVVSDWPAAAGRTTARFAVQTDAEGRERVVRQTDSGKPRSSPWGSRVRLAIGDNGRTYIVGERADYNDRFIMAGNMRQHWFFEPDDAEPLYDLIGNCLNKTWRKK